MQNTKVIPQDHQGVSTLLAFALIPLGGLATDIFIPSLPAMADSFGVSQAAVQGLIMVFMISLGFSQVFAGSVLDSFGRYRINLFCLLVFTLASYGITLQSDITLIYLSRIVQGLSVSLIIVGRRAYFVDVYSGERLKNYTSLFSIIWAAAPIIAPFIGGYLQQGYGWESNFYFLGVLTTIILILEIIYGGESLTVKSPFRGRSLLNTYKNMLSTPDFSLGILIVGLSYSLLVIYGISSPFIIEHVYHFSAVITGYSSLASGAALMTGGIVSKLMIRYPFHRKLMMGSILSVVVGVLMCMVSKFYSNIYTLISLTLALHLLSGFLFNNVYAYCLRRFSTNAGTASGLTGGGIYIVSSILIFGVIRLVSIEGQLILALVNLVLVVLMCFTVYFYLKKAKSY
ncbi:MFS transporter [Echinicola sp. 20G]|uniref:MFS transporter n=1 Tax=Echinicola sp. 20G TaxID=2781961 RepID=UPI00190FCEBE|nr:MFS transporter [Echinicola sp. 20G]